MLDYCLSHLPLFLLLALFTATLFAALKSLPAQNVVAAAFLIAVISGIFQSIGARSGIPFGTFFYTENLGRLLFGYLPWPVPLIWVVIILNSRGVGRLILRPWRELPRYGWLSSGVTCLLAVFFDATLEPFAHANRYWVWQVFKTVPAWYGAPWVNFAAWGAVTLLILGIILPWLIDKKSGKQPPPDYAPLVIWLLCILLLSAANAARTYWPAVIFSVIGAAIVAFIALRNARR